MAVYSICFTLGAVAMLLKLVKFENRLHTFFPRFLLGQTVLSVLLYASALILWPLYQFNQEFGGQPQRSSDVSCSDELASTLCIWDQKLTVAIFKKGLYWKVLKAYKIERCLGNQDGKDKHHRAREKESKTNQRTILPTH